MEKGYTTYGLDTATIRPIKGHDTALTRPRYGLDTATILPRYYLDTASIRPSPLATIRYLFWRKGTWVIMAFIWPWYAMTYQIKESQKWSLLMRCLMTPAGSWSRDRWGYVWLSRHADVKEPWHAVWIMIRCKNNFNRVKYQCTSCIITLYVQIQAISQDPAT